MPKDIERKVYHLKDFQFKEEGEEAGSFSAVFSTLNVIDADGDITLPGAFGEQKVIISAYNHGSWNGELPVGKGRIYEKGEEAIVEGQFFLDTDGGMETYKTIKNVGDLQEFSYALPEIDYEIREEDGQRIRVLKKIRVNEVSPVLMGSGVNTRLLNVKDAKPNGMKLIDHIKSVLDGANEVTKRLQAVKDMREQKGKEISPDTVKRMGDLECALKEAVEKLEQIAQHDIEPNLKMLYKEVLRYHKLIADRRKLCL